MVEIMIGLRAKNNMQQVSFSNGHTIRRRTDIMAADVCQQVCSKIKQSNLQKSIQPDGSTDIILESHLLAFSRYEKEENIKEELLFCNTPSATVTAVNVKVIVASFF